MSTGIPPMRAIRRQSSLLRVQRSIDINPDKQEKEKKFLSLTNGSYKTEFRNLNYLLKCKSITYLLAICGITLTPEKQNEIITKYQIDTRELVDFDRFYHLTQILAKEANSAPPNPEDKEYSK